MTESDDLKVLTQLYQRTLVLQNHTMIPLLQEPQEACAPNGALEANVHEINAHGLTTSKTKGDDHTVVVHLQLVHLIERHHLQLVQDIVQQADPLLIHSVLGHRHHRVHGEVQDLQNGYIASNMQPRVNANMEANANMSIDKHADSFKKANVPLVQNVRMRMSCWTNQSHQDPHHHQAMALTFIRSHHHYPKALECVDNLLIRCLLYTSPSPRDLSISRMPSSA